MEFRKIKPNTDFDHERVLEVARKFNVSAGVAELLLQREIVTDEEIEKFLHPGLDDLHDPFLLSDMQEAVERIQQAIELKQKILIFGDYDVDGITATYILLDYFKSIGVTVDTFLPNRYLDGYGLTKDAVDKVINDFAPNLIITVDCGISGLAEVDYIKEHDIDVIVTDHHDCPDKLPNCLIINAKRPNQKYTFRELCGAGVAFKMVEALGGREIALKYLPVTAIATVSDIVPLVDENRVIVKFGLDRPLEEFPLGLVMLAKELKIENKLSSQEVSFKLAPKINAAGRMGDANHSLRLYCETDKGAIRELITQLLTYNIERQDLCNVVYADCVKELKKSNLANQKAIVLAGESWNIGILGIVAARIAEEYNRPTFLLGKEGEYYKGSCRSIAGMNVHAVLTQMEGIMTSFGGHTMAAGLTIEVGRLEEFKTKIAEILEEQYPDTVFLPYCEYDLDVDVSEISVDFVSCFQVMEPFGCQNTSPLFRIEFDKNNATPMKNNPNHLTIQLETVTLLAFNAAQDFNLISQSSPKECLTELEVDTFRGVKSTKGIIKHVQLKSAPNIGAERIGGEYIKQLGLSSNGKRPAYMTYDKEDLGEILKKDDSSYGTLIIANTLHSYKDFIENQPYTQNIVCFKYLNINNNNGYNTICLCPSLQNDFSDFNRIILLDRVLDEAYLVYFNENTTAQIFLPQYSPFIYSPFKSIDISRKVFGEYFCLFKKAAKQRLTAFDDYNYFNKLKRTQRDINYVQFVACLATFEQLGLVKINSDLGEYSIEIISSISTKLENSHFYNKLELILKSY